MTSDDAETVPATIAVRPWGRRGLWLAVVMDGSTVIARLFALSEDAAFQRAREWVAPRAAVRANWSEICEATDN